MKRITISIAVFLVTCAAFAHDKAEIVDAHVKAVGGLEAFGKLTSVQRSGDASLTGAIGDMSGTFEDKIIVGKKAFTTTDLGDYQDRSASDGTTGWTENSMMGTMDMPADQLEAFKTQLQVEPIVFAVKAGKADAIKLLDHETIEGTEYHVVQVEGSKAKFYIDPKTNLCTRAWMTMNDPQMGEAEVVTTMSEHQEHNGVKFPGKVVINVGDGIVTVTYTYKTTTLNEKIDESIFAKP